MKEVSEGHSDPVSDELMKRLIYNEKMAELGRISAGVVHELNAPLSVISSAAQLILREEDLSLFVREMVERINSESQRLSRLTRGLLGFGSHDEHLCELDVNVTISFILDFITYEAARRGVRVLRYLDHQLPLVTIDGNALKQVLLNIVMNALQAMEGDGGRLMVESAGLDDHTVVIRVSDTGPGIPSEIQGKIFDPYFTTKQQGEGTGLGLFVSRRLMESLGGQIKVSSEVGRGTSFALVIPFAP